MASNYVANSQNNKQFSTAVFAFEVKQLTLFHTRIETKTKKKEAKLKASKTNLFCNNIWIGEICLFLSYNIETKCVEKCPKCPKTVKNVRNDCRNHWPTIHRGTQHIIYQNKKKKKNKKNGKLFFFVTRTCWFCCNTFDGISAYIYTSYTTYIHTPSRISHLISIN